MAVKIRLARKGRKRLASYNIVVADSRAPRDGKFIEKIGNYSPFGGCMDVAIDRALYWLLQGAEPTDTTRSILSKKGVMLKKHLQVGVLKGSISQEEADRKFSEWEQSKSKSL